ncbi:MAG: RluA family pseudouridine synthase [Candidatus Eisenbacteria bacterium]|nr:RluA family pseudouridine synthase [Candidatus Eisenbacteria bacterium]
MAPRDDATARWIRRGSCRVPPAEAGQRLDAFLARAFRYRSRTQWAALVKAGRIRCNGAVVRPGRSLRPGDWIEYLPDPRPEPRVDRRYRVLFEDESILAVRKPANLPVHPSGRYFRNTLLLMLLEERGEDLDTTGLRIVHRLDRETSGVILFGKGREAASALAIQFETRQVAKRYLAIVHGRPKEDRFLVDAPVGRDPRSPVRKAMTVLEDGRPARTSFRVVRRSGEHALLIARPHTGRLHQIRVHLRHAGLPIVGDKVYGRDPRLFLRFVEGSLSPEDRLRLVWRRQALHAWRLTLRHPRDGSRLSLHAPAGRSWLRLAARLELGRLP